MVASHTGDGEHVDWWDLEVVVPEEIYLGLKALEVRGVQKCDYTTAVNTAYRIGRYDLADWLRLNAHLYYQGCRVGFKLEDGKPGRRD